jgi:hypothetical protein
MDARRTWSTLKHVALARDPTLAASKGAVRTAVFVTVALAVSRLTHNPQTTVFCAFSGVAILLIVGFSGRRASVFWHLLGLVVTGAILIVIGTLCSQNAALALVAMAVVGFCVCFGSIISPSAVQSTTGVLLMFVLPVSLPAAPHEIFPRLLGIGIAAAFAIPASLFFLPPQARSVLREQLADIADDLGDLASAYARGDSTEVAAQRVQAALKQLRDLYEATAYVPVGVSADDRALGRLVALVAAAARRLLDDVDATRPPHGLTPASPRRTGRSMSSQLRFSTPAASSSAVLHGATISTQRLDPTCGWRVCNSSTRATGPRKPRWPACGLAAGFSTTRVVGTAGRSAISYDYRMHSVWDSGHRRCLGRSIPLSATRWWRSGCLDYSRGKNSRRVPEPTSETGFGAQRLVCGGSLVPIPCGFVTAYGASSPFLSRFWLSS